MKVTTTTINKAARALLERLQWDLEKARTLVRDLRKPQSKEEQQANVTALKKLKQARWKKELARRKANKTAMAINKRVRAVNKEWRRKEERRLRRVAKWDWVYGSRNKERLKKNKELRYRSSQLRKKNDNWREAEITKINKEEGLLLGLAGARLQRIRRDEEKTDGELAERLVRCAGGRQDALTLLTRVWDWQERWMRDLVSRLGENSRSAASLVRAGASPEAKELIAIAGGVEDAVALVRRIAAEIANSAAASPKPAIIRFISVEDESEDPPGTH